jgi:hypothetical protein
MYKRLCSAFNALGPIIPYCVMNQSRTKEVTTRRISLCQVVRRHCCTINCSATGGRNWLGFSVR